VAAELTVAATEMHPVARGIKPASPAFPVGPFITHKYFWASVRAVVAKAQVNQKGTFH